MVAFCYANPQFLHSHSGSLSNHQTPLTRTTGSPRFSHSLTRAMGSPSLIINGLPSDHQTLSLVQRAPPRFSHTLIRATGSPSDLSNSLTRRNGLARSLLTHNCYKYSAISPLRLYSNTYLFPHVHFLNSIHSPIHSPLVFFFSLTHLSFSYHQEWAVVV